MSYTRGDYYNWRSSTHMNLWVRKPEDDITEYVKDCGFASGVAIPQELFDELVMMRYAELLKEGKVTATEDRATHKWSGNGGAYAALEHSKSRGRAD